MRRSYGLWLVAVVAFASAFLPAAAAAAADAPIDPWLPGGLQDTITAADNGSTITGLTPISASQGSGWQLTLDADPSGVLHAPSMPITWDATGGHVVMAFMLRAASGEEHGIVVHADCAIVPGQVCDGPPPINGPGYLMFGTWTWSNFTPPPGGTRSGPVQFIPSRTGASDYRVLFSIVFGAPDLVPVPAPPPPPPAPAPPAPPATDGPPAATPGCKSTSLITIGGITAQTGCWQPHADGSLTALAGSAVRVGGLDLVAGKAGVTFHPKTKKVDGDVEVKFGVIPVYKGKIAWNLGEPVEVVPNEAAKLKGLTLSGSLVFDFAPAFSTATATLELPKVFKAPNGNGVSGAMTVRLTQAGGLQIDSAEIKAGAIQAGSVGIHDIVLKYEATEGGDRWSGAAALTLPGSTSIAGDMSFLNGSFESANVAVDHEFALGDTGFFFQELRAGVRTNPFILSGGVTVSAGPSIDDITALEAKGDVTIQFTSPAKITVSGSITLFKKMQVGEAEADLDTSGSFTFHGKADFEIEKTGIVGTIDGALTRTAFEADGSVQVRVLGHTAGDARAVVSDKGVAACAKIGWPSVGFGYHWGDSSPQAFASFSSCDFSGYTSAEAGLTTSSLLGATARSFRVVVPKGVKTEVFKVAGATSAPLVTVTGPHRALFSAPLDGSGRSDHRVFIVQDQTTKTTFVAVRNPAPGVWKVVGETAADVLSSVHVAQTAPPARVRATATATAGSRRLTVRAQFPSSPNRIVRLFDRSGGHLQLLGTLRTSGSFAARAADSLGAVHELVAEVDQGGVPATIATVSRFRLSPIKPAGRISKLTKTVSAKGFELRWRPAPRAVSYLLSTTIGKSTALRRLTVTHVLEKVTHRPVELALTPIDRFGRRGPTTNVTIRG